jgi:gluconate 2-dehydrogenase gamma chain
MKSGGASTMEELVFFNESQGRTVEAMVARIFPGDASDPGAREAGVLFYIDLALAGFYSDLQSLYQRGIWELDCFCSDRHGAPFSGLADEQQDTVLAAISREPDQLQEPEPDDLEALAKFFAVVRQHTIEGMFSDPVYGGNRDAVGWKLLGFPGAQWGYSAGQMRPGFDATTIPILTLSELRQQRGGDGERGDG